MNENSESLSGSASPCEDAHFKNVFSPQRIETDVDVSSTKRLLEILSSVFTKGNTFVIDKDTIFQTLLERERLGSTDLGNGVLIPHGRLNELPYPIGAIIRPKTALKTNGDASSRIWIACGLLVPAECADVHVKLLARLARNFEIGKLDQKLKSAGSATELYEQLIKYDSDSVE